MVMEATPNVMCVVDDHWFKYIADFGMASLDDQYSMEAYFRLQVTKNLCNHRSAAVDQFRP